MDEDVTLANRTREKKKKKTNEWLSHVNTDTWTGRFRFSIFFFFYFVSYFFTSCTYVFPPPSKSAKSKYRHSLWRFQHRGFTMAGGAAYFMIAAVSRFYIVSPADMDLSRDVGSARYRSKLYAKCSFLPFFFFCIGRNIGDNRRCGENEIKFSKHSPWFNLKYISY